MKKSAFIGCLLSVLALCSCDMINDILNEGSGIDASGANGSGADGSSTEGITDKSRIVNGDKELPSSINTSFDYDDMIDYNHKTEGFNGNRYYLNNFNDYMTSNGAPEVTKFPYMGDPQVYFENGSFYITGTDDKYGSKVMSMYSSTDLKTFVRHHQVDADNKNEALWVDTSKHAIFAPELYKFGDTYYLYYSDVSKTNNKRYISVATSDSPTGPFHENILSQPTFDHTLCSIADVANYDVLDQTVFDDNGQLYMYFSSYITGNEQRIYGVKMNSPTSVDWSTCVLLSKPGYRVPNDLSATLVWECWPPVTSGSFRVNEAPFMLKLGNKYYLTYVVNHNRQRYYTACYAVGDSPLGVFTKPYTNGKLWTNLLYGCAGANGEAAGGYKDAPTYKMWDNYMSGVGHHAITKIGDEYMIINHGFINYDHWDEKDIRGVVFDRLAIDKDGKLVTGAPTRTIQPQFTAISGVKNITSEATMAVSGVSNAEYLTDGKFTNFPFKDTDNILSEPQINYEASLEEGKSYIKFTFEETKHITGLFIYNSGSYDKVCLDDIPFINFRNGNVIKNLQFDVDNYIDTSKKFVRPGSSYHVDFPSGVETKQLVIAFDNPQSVCLSEIMILGE